MAQLHLLSPVGFRAGAVHAGIKTRRAPDVGLLLCDTSATAAAVFTTNKVVAAPVLVGRRNVAAGKLRAVVVNSGNANACTGRHGLRDAQRMCQLTGQLIGASPEQVLPCSTGIIGHRLPMNRIENGIALAAAGLGNTEVHALGFADAILTTDLVRKTAATQFKIGRWTVRIAGVCKGSGMIAPRLELPSKRQISPHATMLAYLTTDAAISPARLRRLLHDAADTSFNALTVDNHTSTNDTAAILASGASGAKIDTSRATDAFTKALEEVCQALAYQIAADGEGATKVLAITVREARSHADAARIARAIADSPLVKCAMHGNDPNWGRIVSAAGMVKAAFDPDRAVLRLQGTAVFRRGRPLPFDTAALSQALDVKHVDLELRCGLGKAAATCWTCDLSKQYVTINADYHT